MFHLMAVHGGDIGEIPYETDRLRFIGRGHTVADPQAMGDASALSGALPAVRAPCWIRSSRSVIASRSLQKKRPRSILSPESVEQVAGFALLAASPALWAGLTIP